MSVGIDLDEFEENGVGFVVVLENGYSLLQGVGCQPIIAVEEADK